MKNKYNSTVRLGKKMNECITTEKATTLVMSYHLYPDLWWHWFKKRYSCSFLCCSWSVVPGDGIRTCEAMPYILLPLCWLPLLEVLEEICCAFPLFSPPFLPWLYGTLACSVSRPSELEPRPVKVRAGKTIDWKKIKLN